MSEESDALALKTSDNSESLQAVQVLGAVPSPEITVEVEGLCLICP